MGGRWKNYGRKGYLDIAKTLSRMKNIYSWTQLSHALCHQTIFSRSAKPVSISHMLHTKIIKCVGVH